MRNIALAFATTSMMLISLTVKAQQPEKDKIVVIGSASIEVPADRAQVTVSLWFSDLLDAKKAFDLHKDAESRLIHFIRDHGIHDSSVTYSLLSISLTQDYGRPGSIPQKYNTGQTVIITLTDIARLPAFEMDLVASGFTSFSEEFRSSKGVEAQKDAIAGAVRQARSKAELMAAAAGRKIQKISRIADTEETEPTIARYYGTHPRAYATSATRSVDKLVNIPQVIAVEKQVKVTFELAQ
jgi:uncharacterized protein